MLTDLNFASLRLCFYLLIPCYRIRCLSQFKFYNISSLFLYKSAFIVCTLPFCEHNGFQSADFVLLRFRYDVIQYFSNATVVLFLYVSSKPDYQNSPLFYLNPIVGPIQGDYFNRATIGDL